MAVKEVLDVEERLNAHSERLNKVDDRLNLHDEQIQELKKYDKEKHERLQSIEKIDEDHEKRLQEVEKNYSKLENTIVSENREMRSFFQSNMDKLWDLTKSRDDQRHEINKTKIERWSDIFIKLVGGGSILYIIIETFVK